MSSNKDIEKQPKIEENLKSLDGSNNGIKSDQFKVIIIIFIVIITISVLIMLNLGGSDISLIDRVLSKEVGSSKSTSSSKSASSGAKNSSSKKTSQKAPSKNNSSSGQTDEDEGFYEEDMLGDINIENENSSSSGNGGQPDEDDGQGGLVPPPEIEYPDIEEDENITIDHSKEIGVIRDKIYNDYGVWVEYGVGIPSYFNRYIQDHLTASSKIYEMIVDIQNTLSKYPLGFFRDFSKPINFVLSERLSVVSPENNRPAVGVVDRGYDGEDWIIYRYVGGGFIKNLNYYISDLIISEMEDGGVDFGLAMSSYNPANFNYGRVNSILSYPNNKNGYFLDDISQMNYRYDLSSVFSCIISDTRHNPYFNHGHNIRKKADFFIDMISQKFPSAASHRNISSWNIKIK